MKHLILFTLFVLPFSTHAQSPVYGVDPQSNDLYTIDTTNFTETTQTITSNLGTVDGCNGLTSDPCGLNYIVYKTGGDRRLGTIDLSTASITDIGLLSDNIANIAYDTSTNILYGVTGDGATTPEALYEINTATAGMLFITNLGNGDDGESIEFNPVDGLIYHWSGWDIGNVIMETIDPNTFNITSSITLSGDPLYNVGASVYAGNNRFLISDVNEETMHWVTTSGVVTTTSSDLILKGLSFGLADLADNALLSASPDDTICTGETAVISCLNPNVTYEWFENGVSTGVTTSDFSTTNAGTFACQITESVCNTSDIDSVTIVVQNLPSVSLTPTGPLQICPGDSVNISGSSGGTSQWYLNGNIIAGETDNSIEATLPGIYNMTKTNLNGCSDSAAVGVIVTELSAPVVTLSPTGPLSFCPGDSVAITGSGAGTSQWYLNGSILAGETANVIQASVPGVYNMLNTNTNNCSDSAAAGVVVSEATVPNVILTPSPEAKFCGPGSVDISVNAGGGTVQWYMDGVIISGATNNTYSASSEGIYNAIKTNMSGCSDSAAVGVEAIDTCLLDVSAYSIDENINVYPNPASSVVTIDFSKSQQVTVRSITIIGIEGRIVTRINMDGILSNQLNIELDDYNSGLYIIQIETEKGILFKDLIVK